MEKGVGEVSQGVRHSHGGGSDDVYLVAAVVEEGRTDVESTGGVGSPGGAGGGRLVRIAQLADGMEGVGVQVEGKAVETVVGGQRWIGAPGEKVVEGKLDGGEDLIPEVEGELGVDRGKGGDDVILRSANKALCEVGTVVVGRDELD